MKRWNAIRSKVLTSADDEILTVNTMLPEGFKGIHYNAAKNEPIPDMQFDLILFENVICGSYNLIDEFEKLFCKLKKGGVLAVKEKICGNEDAWLNSLVFKLDKKHVRFYRAEEIISAGSQYFELADFIRYPEIMSYNRNPEAEAEMINFPEEILDRISPEAEGNTFQLNIFTGLFMWEHKINSADGI